MSSHRAPFPDRNLWSVNNAMTEAIKVLKEVPQQQYGVSIGRYFGRFLRAASGSQVAIPVDIPDEASTAVEEILEAVSADESGFRTNLLPPLSEILATNGVGTSSLDVVLDDFDPIAN